MARVLTIKNVIIMKINSERSLVWLLYCCTGGHFDPVAGCVDASLVCSDSFALATNFALTGKDNHLLELHHEGNTPLWIVPGDVVSVAFAQDGNGDWWPTGAMKPYTPKGRAGQCGDANGKEVCP